MNEYLYHITSEDVLPEILKHGLYPKIGDRSAAVGETEAHIFLCKSKDLPYWQILLDQSVILQIDKSQIKNATSEFQYSYYNEYLYDDCIPASAITRVQGFKPNKTHMQNLCKSYVYSINNLVLTTIKYYETNDEIRKLSYMLHLNDLYPAILHSLSKLKYDCIETIDLRSYITDIGESGEYTFLDNFKGSELKLYQQMIKYENDSLTQYIHSLYNYIITNFSECLELNTGGWTG